MPYILKPNEFFARDPNNNRGYLPQNVIATQTADEQIALVEAAGASTIAAVQQAVADSQAAVASIDSQRDTMIAAIASIAGSGTDTTLTQSDVAADAKATGDAVSDLKSAINNDINVAALWEQGGIATASGEPSTANARIRTANYIPNSISRIIVSSGYKFLLAAYLNGVYQGMWNGTEYVKSAAYNTAPVDLDYSNGYSYKIVLGNSGNTNIDTSVYYNIGLIQYTDKTLTIEGKPADAKKTGDKIDSILYDLTKVLDFRESKATDITSGDLDDYRTIGNYKITSSSIAASIDNVPVIGAGRLIVSSTFFSTRFLQIWMTAVDQSIAYRFGTDAAWDDWQFIGEEKETILVFGDSWSDTVVSSVKDKWPKFFAESVKQNMVIYARSGSQISGADDFKQNGTVGGQVAYAITDNTYNHKMVKTIFMMGGVNDFRQGKTAHTVINAWCGLIDRLREEFTNARIICAINNQIFVNTEQLNYIRAVEQGLREYGIPAYKMLGWFPESYYKVDRVHPDVAGYEMIAANMVALYRGGPVNYAQNVYTSSNVSTTITSLKITEFFTDSSVTRKIEVEKLSNAEDETESISIPNSSTLALNVPFACPLMKNSGTLACIFAEGTSPDSTDQSASDKQATTDTMDIVMPSPSGAGKYTGIVII